MGSKPYHSLLNSLHCPEGWLKPSHRGHWMCFESRSNKRSYKEGKSKFTGFQQIQQTSIRIQKHTGFNSTALWIVKLCLFPWIQAGRKGFLWLWHGARWFAFPQLSAFGNRNWLLPALPPAPAPSSACPQAGWSCPHPNSCLSTPRPGSHSGLSSFSLHGYTRPFQAHISLAACTIMCALTSCEHLKLAVECNKSGLFWVPQINGACIFLKKYLKDFGHLVDKY